MRYAVWAIIADVNDTATKNVVYFFQILKMIKYHSRSFEIENFFSVDPVDEPDTESDYVCEVSSHIHIIL